MSNEETADEKLTRVAEEVKLLLDREGVTSHLLNIAIDDTKSLSSMKMSAIKWGALVTETIKADESLKSITAFSLGFHMKPENFTKGQMVFINSQEDFISLMIDKMGCENPIKKRYENN